ncbi:MAG: hypothetical protein HZB33_05995 [Nitrospirae bacterium]|nr:hypothetical protein [Nitrospirota bacterium]
MTQRPLPNLSQIKRGGNVVQSFTYDNIGRVETQTDATGLVLGYDYNNLDQLTKILYPDTVYDVNNNPTAKFVSIEHSSCCPRIIDSTTDRAGLTTYYTHDALKRLTQKQGPDGTIKYEYDDNGNLKKMRDPGNKPTSFEYNLDNRLIKKIHADNKFIKYDYDLARLLTKVTNSRDIEKSYTYDPNHNPLTIGYSDSTPGVVFTYDDYNRAVTRTDGMGLYQFGYDVDGRTTSVDGPWENDSISYQYNELGQFTDMTPQGGQAITYTYDTIGRLEDIQAGLNVHTYGYADVNPLIQSLTRPNGSMTEYQYNDPLKRLTALTSKNSSNQVINSYGYTYNNLDVIDNETVTNGTPITSFIEGVTTYDNNSLNQLLAASNPNRTFIYDDDGNMTQGYTPDGYTLTMTYDAENRLKTAEYTDSSSVVHRTEYSYSGDNLLAEVKKYTDGSLISDTRYVRAGFLPVQERDGSNAVMREYTWGQNYGGGIGGLLNLKQGGLNYSYLYDGKGNVTTLLDPSQNVVAAYAYDPFGALITKTGTLNQPYQFSTKEYDPETGLTYYGYRFYNAAAGKWMTRDPLGERGGVNLYKAVGNNPVNFVDPFGLHWIAGSFGPIPHTHAGENGPVTGVNPDDPGAWPGDPQHVGPSSCEKDCSQFLSRCYMLAGIGGATTGIVCNTVCVAGTGGPGIVFCRVVCSGTGASVGGALQVSCYAAYQKCMDKCNCKQ